MTEQEKEATVIMLLSQMVNNQKFILGAIGLNIAATLLILWRHGAL